jgi:hypothetical protein
MGSTLPKVEPSQLSITIMISLWSLKSKTTKSMFQRASFGITMLKTALPWKRLISEDPGSDSQKKYWQTHRIKKELPTRYNNCESNEQLRATSKVFGQIRPRTYKYDSQHQDVD